MKMAVTTMSKYTSLLRTYFDQYQDGTKSTKDIIESGRTTLFDFDYPIYDAEYKKIFETHFIRKFYLREIGYETFGLFKFQLETWLLINMPYFNKMFESELLEFDPLTNSKMNVTYTKKNDKSQTDESNTIGNKSSNVDANKTGTTSGTTSGTTTGTNTSNTDQSHQESSNASNTANKSEDTTTNEDDFQRDLESDNPDTRLALTANDGEGVIEYANKIKEQNANNNKSQNSSGTSNSQSSNDGSSNDSVASSQNTNATANESSDSTSNETDNTKITENDERNNSLKSTINDVEDFIQYRAGKIGVQTYPKMIQEYRQSLLRIERTIFDEMNELFMLLY